MIIAILILLVIVSVAWALLALWDMQKQMSSTSAIKKTLSKGRVLFQQDKKQR